jgi:UDP-GlcNAc:undecaprenyl-phosphate GlcNAc-1-phosphate transferase
LVKIAPGRGWVVFPRRDRWSKRIVAQFGGIPILLAFTIGDLFLTAGRESVFLLFLVWGVGFLGLADDIIGLTPKAKLAGQAFLAFLAVYAGYVHPLTHVALLNSLFTILWIVGITNALNLLDNMDGLAAGIAIIALAQIMLFAGRGALIRGPALCMLASIMGFLIFNSYPAKVFMGDCGSLAIGFFLACASVNTAAHLSGLGSAVLVPCLILFIPLFDTLLVSVTRRVNGKAISQGAHDHTSHRLVLIGMNDRKAVALLYAIAIAAGASILFWKSAWSDLGAGIVVLFLIGAILFWLYLAKLRLPDHWLSQAKVAPIVLPKSVQQFLAAAAVILLDSVLIVVGLYFAYVVRFGRLDQATRTAFLLAAALAIPAKLLVLIACGIYRIRWSIRRTGDTVMALKAAVFASLFFAGASLILPKARALPVTVLSLDALFSSCLLLLCRASTSIFEKVLGAAKFPASDQRVEQQIGEMLPRSMTPELIAKMSTTKPTAVTTTKQERTVPRLEV